MLLPLSRLPTAARKMAVAFDLDGTLAPNSGRMGINYLAKNHPLALLGVLAHPFTLPLWAWSRVPSFGSLRPLLKWSQRLSQHPLYKEKLAQFSEQDLGHLIFPHMAEELALRRANLQTTVLITGAFRPFAEPLLRRLQADHLYVNDGFWPMPVTGRKKPNILGALFEAQGLTAHAVYTDSYWDRDMALQFGWAQVFAVKPDSKFRRLAEQKGWTILDKAPARRPDLPSSVRSYAAEVICGSGHYAALRFDFYRKLAGRMERQDVLLKRFLEGHPDQEPNTLQDLLGGIGLYLTEPVEVRRDLADDLGMDWDQRAFLLYETLVKRNPASILPLSLLPIPGV